MSFLLKRADYVNGHKKYGSKVRKARGSHGGLQIAKKVRLPTQLKSKKLYCRNCLVQLEAKKLPIVCKQCGNLNVKPLRSRK